MVPRADERAGIGTSISGEWTHMASIPTTSILKVVDQASKKVYS